MRLLFYLATFWLWANKCVYLPRYRLRPWLKQLFRWQSEGYPDFRFPWCFWWLLRTVAWHWGCPSIASSFPTAFYLICSCASLFPVKPVLFSKRCYPYLYMFRSREKALQWLSHMLNWAWYSPVQVDYLRLVVCYSCRVGLCSSCGDRGDSCAICCSSCTRWPVVN